MSKTIDQRVVEMQFDNRHFEKNVQTSLSTLDKLKQSLNFNGAAKGLNDINTAASRCNMSGLGNAIDTVYTKFSVLEVMGVTALANITNSAVNAGKRLVKALTIEPVTTGFNEYETKINAIQTIMSNTASKGTTMEDITRVINELNTYADKTIYNFAEMTRNIGTFTAAGVGLEESASAIQGIANLAAASGSTSQQASTAMYQLSQALASGTVKLMDWNSVVNAGMGGEKFQEALKATAREHGVAVDEMIKKNGSFRESLSEGWITADILNETLNKFTVDGAKKYAEAMVASGKYTKEQADALIKEARAMEDAATKVKTFSQLWDTMKESVQSGWSQTWEIIIGDFEEAREWLSKLSDTFGAFISAISNARNNLLGGALNSKWEQLNEKIEAAGVSTDVFNDKLKETLKENGYDVDKLTDKYGSLGKAIEKGKVPSSILTKTIKKLVGVQGDATKSTDEVTKSTKELNKVVEEVIDGKWGSYEERWKALGEAGYDWAEVQTLVNKKLGSSITHLSELSKEQKKNAEQLSKLSDEQLKNKGYTEEQIVALRELEKAAEDGGTSINDLINSIEKPSGRTLLWESFSNILEGIGEALEIVGKAWNNVFGKDEGEKTGSEKLYSLIESFNDLTESMTFSEEQAESFQKIMEGIFSAFDLGFLIFKGGLPAMIKLLNAVLALFGTNIIKVMEKLAGYVTTFHDWVNANTMLLDPLNKTAAVLVAVIEGIGGCIKAFLDLKIISEAISNIWTKLKELFGKFSLDFDGFGVDGVVNTINSFFENIQNAIKNLDGIPIAKDFIDGFVIGILDGINAVVDVVMSIGECILTAIRDVLGIHSPSREAYIIGVNFITGFYNAIRETSVMVWQQLREFSNQCLKYLRHGFLKIDFGKVFAGGVILSSLLIFKQMVDTFKILARPVEALSDLLDGVGGMFSSIGSAIKGVGQALEKNIKAKALEHRSKAILNFAIAIGVMAGSLYVLSKISWPDLGKAALAIGVLAGILIVLLKLTEKMNKVGELTIKAGVIIGIAASLVIVAIALKKLASIDLEDVPTVLATFALAITGLLTLVWGFGKFVNVKNEAIIVKMGSILLQMSLALMAMVTVIRVASKLNGSDVSKAVSVLTLIGVMFGAMIAISKLAGKNANKAGSMLRNMAFAFLIMIAVIKVASMLDGDQVNQGLGVITLVGLLFTAFIAVSSLAGAHATKAGGMLLMMSIAFMLMVEVIDQAAKIDPADVNKGIKVMAAIGILFSALIAISSLAGKNSLKAGSMLLMASGAILVLAGAMFVLSYIDPKGLMRAVTAVGIIGLMFMGLIAVTKYAQDCKSTLVVITVAVGILAFVLTALSFVDPSSLITASIAISTMLGMFALLIASTKFLKGTKGARIALIELTVLVGILTGAVYLLSRIDSEDAIRATASLSILLLAFSGSLAIIGKAGNMAKISVKNLAIMMIVVTLLAGILAALAYLDITPSIQAASAISILLLSMTAALVILSKAKAVSVTSIGTLALMGLVVGELAVILGLLSHFNVEPSMKTVAAISILLLSMTAALVILGYAKPTAVVAVGALALMGLVVGELAVILALMSHFDVNPSIETAKALSLLLVSMSAALGILTVIGMGGPAAFVGVAALATMITGIGGLIVAIGALVEEFPKLKTFIDEGIPVIDQIGHAIGSFFGNIVGGFVEGTMTGLPQVGTTLSEFMTNAKPFFDGINAIDPSKVEATKSLAEMILILTQADFLDSLSSWIGGGGYSLASFGSELAAFAPYLAKFAAGVTGIDASTVESSANAAKTLAEFAAAIPNEGGKLALWVGENSLSAFGKELATFGPYLRAYADSVIGMDVEAVKTSAEAAKALGDVAGNIPNLGGLASLFTGDNTLDLFAPQLKAFGIGMKEYSDSIVGLNTEAIVNSVDGVKALVDVASVIPNTGGIASWFAGNNDLGAFGAQLVPFGTSLKDYSLAVANINIENIEKSKTAVDTLTRIIKKTSSIDDSGVSIFKRAIAKLSDISLDGFVSSFSELSPRLETIGSGMVDAIVKGVTDKKATFDEFFTKLIQESLDKIDSRELAFKVAGIELMANLLNGIASKKDIISRSLTSTLDGLTETIRGYYDSFYKAGSYLVSGFVGGISANQYKAAAKARAMASAAAEAAKDELDEHSPSKVGYEIGDYFGIAFVNALDDYANKAYKAGSEMASSAKTGLSNAIGRISDAINSNIDTQPTIRPVLDLSDISSGVSRMDSMFGINPSVGVLANVGSINTMMNGRNQNGVNGDVVSAIDKLRGDLSNIGNTSYNINGITYDDESIVANAIRTIVRAAKVERRS